MVDAEAIAAASVEVDDRYVIVEWGGERRSLLTPREAYELAGWIESDIDESVELSESLEDAADTLRFGV